MKSTEDLHLESAIEKKLVASLERNLARAGITDVGTEVLVRELADTSALSGLGGDLTSGAQAFDGGLGRWNPFRSFRKSNKKALAKRILGRSLKVNRPGGKVAIVKKSNVIAAMRPIIRQKAKLMAKGAKTAAKRIAKISTPAAGRAVVKPGAVMRLNHEVQQDIMRAIPEAAVTGGRFFGMGTYARPDDVEGASSVAGGEISGLGDDIERGAAVFGDDIRSGASAFDDFITAGEIEDAGVVSGFGDDLDAGAQAFDDFIVEGDIDDVPLDGMGDDITAGAQAFDGLGMIRPKVFTGRMPGATRQVWTDTFIDDPSLDWSKMVYPRGGVRELSQRPPTVKNAAKMAKIATKVAVDVMKKTPGTLNQKMTKAAVAVSKLGVKNPKRIGVGQAQTAGQAAFRPVMKGIQRFAGWRWGKRAKRGSAVSRMIAKRKSGQMSGFDGNGGW